MSSLEIAKNYIAAFGEAESTSEQVGRFNFRVPSTGNTPQHDAAALLVQAALRAYSPDAQMQREGDAWVARNVTIHNFPINSSKAIASSIFHSFSNGWEKDSDGNYRNTHMTHPELLLFAPGNEKAEMLIEYKGEVIRRDEQFGAISRAHEAALGADKETYKEATRPVSMPYAGIVLTAEEMQNAADFFGFENPLEQSATRA